MKVMFLIGMPVSSRRCAQIVGPIVLVWRWKAKSLNELFSVKITHLSRPIDVDLTKPSLYLHLSCSL